MSRMLLKDKTVHNQKLLDSYKGQPCVLTGSTNTHAGHRCKRSKLRLDIPENLDPLNDRINQLIEDGREAFIDYIDMVFGMNLRTRMLNLFNKNTGGNCTNFNEVFDVLTDTDEKIYNQYKGKVLMNDQKPKSKRKIASRGFETKKSKYKRKVDGSLVLR